MEQKRFGRDLDSRIGAIEEQNDEIEIGILEGQQTISMPEILKVIKFH